MQGKCFLLIVHIIKTSFDSEPLFANISSQTTINICVDKLFENKAEVNHLIKETFNLLTVIGYFRLFIHFRWKIYKQEDCVAMSSPLPPTLANVFSCHVKEQWMSDCPIDYKPISYRRYVDAVFLLFFSELWVTKYLNCMNPKHWNIKFTVEHEENNSLSFVNIKTLRDSEKLHTSVYSKPAFTGVLTNFESFLPILYKYNFVSTLSHRDCMICFSYRTLHFEILKLKQIFRSNGYPENFVDRCIKMYLAKVFIKHPHIFIMPKKELVCVLPFLAKKSLEMKKTKAKCYWKKNLTILQIKAIFKSSSKIVNHFPFTDVLLKKLCSGIVYSFKCNSSNAIYYGKTKRHFKVRLAQHMGNLHLTNKRFKNVKLLAISDHLLTCDCNINFSDFIILSKDFNLLIKESLLLAHARRVLKKRLNLPHKSYLNRQNLIVVYRLDYCF